MKKLTLLALAFVLASGAALYAQDDEKKSSKKRHKTKQEFSMDIGMNNYLSNGQFPDASNEQYTIKPWGSWYVSLGSAYLTKVAGPLYLEWGGDVSWYNFKFQDPSTLIVKNPADVSFVENPDASQVYNKSKMTVSYANVSMVPMLKFGSKKNALRIGAGVYGGYKLASYAKYVYEIDDQTIKDRESDNYFVENLRYGFRARFGFKDLDIFANYDMNSLFTQGRGPDLHAISAGITISDLFD